ncbi:MAG: molecular chaperone HtpG [Planctomycetaceae bacterium]|nr:molecular chaperone HtpG [Planctomycetaceae bacterium]
MTAETAPQQIAFQAEIKQLLHILSHSLYQNREVAIRELVSNASDALDKLRHVSLTDDDATDAAVLEIHVEPDDDAHTLVIRDNGIGMTRDELVKNLGTIAHSGSLEFLKNSQGDAAQDVSLIGQFGVGFYSAFMLADTVEVLTRSDQEETGWRWQSDGTGSFTIDEADDLPRGTTIKLHLREDAHEFARDERIKYVLTQYSTFVPHPIKLDDEQVNDQRPIWVEPKSQLDDQQYEKFYQYLSHRASETPLWHLHLSSDSPFQFHAILYCPGTNFEAMGFGKDEHGLHLCAKRILVDNDCRELLPEYLRFLYGLVDSADLPLNVSRQALQDDSVFRKIRKVLVKRVLDRLGKLAKDDDDYLDFYRQFGFILREGVSSDYDNRDKIAALLRFTSSHAEADDALTSLDDYLERADDDQMQIYYIGGADLGTIRKNPNLEIFRKKGLEVLYLTDPVDEFVLTNLGAYNEKQLTSIDAADVDLPEISAASDKDDADDQTKDGKGEDASPGFEKVLTLFREALGTQVEEVRQSKRLTDSPCCLVNPEGAMSTQLQKVLSATNKDFEMSKRILEINPHAPLIERLSQLSGNDEQAEFIKNCGCQLYSNALVLSGVALDAEDMVARVQDFMQELAQGRSSIIT